jgi:hypothetical protein
MLLLRPRRPRRRRSVRIAKAKGKAAKVAAAKRRKQWKKTTPKTEKVEMCLLCTERPCAKKRQFECHHVLCDVCDGEWTIATKANMRATSCPFCRASPTWGKVVAGPNGVVELPYFNRAVVYSAYVMGGKIQSYVDRRIAVEGEQLTRVLKAPAAEVCVTLEKLRRHSAWHGRFDLFGRHVVFPVGPVGMPPALRADALPHLPQFAA